MRILVDGLKKETSVSVTVWSMLRWWSLLRWAGVLSFFFFLNVCFVYKAVWRCSVPRQRGVWIKVFDFVEMREISFYDLSLGVTMDLIPPESEHWQQLVGFLNNTDPLIQSKLPLRVELTYENHKADKHSQAPHPTIQTFKTSDIQGRCAPCGAMKSMSIAKHQVLIPPKNPPPVDRPTDLPKLLWGSRRISRRKKSDVPPLPLWFGSLKSVWALTTKIPGTNRSTCDPFDATEVQPLQGRVFRARRLCGSRVVQAVGWVGR